MSELLFNDSLLRGSIGHNMMKEKDLGSIFVCPQCQGHLVEQYHLMLCESCGQDWKVIGEQIPSLATKDHYWNQIPRERMSLLIATAQKDGYRYALESELLPNTDDYTLHYALDESRGDFKFVLPLSRQSRVLDIGCGWGAVTTALARSAGLVVGLDTTSETLEFIEVRAQQENIENLVLGHIDPIDYGELPLVSGYFDVVVLNGVLEWVGSSNMLVSVEQAQNLALRELWRLLRPGGTIYIGIENRFGLNYLLGARDDHSGLRFTGVLPRPVSNAYMRTIKKAPYRTYTHSQKGYERLLREAGFSEIDFFLPIKSYRDPYFLIPLRDMRAKRYYVKYLMVKRKPRYLLYRLIWYLGFKLHLDQFIAPSFAIIGKKPDD